MYVWKNRTYKYGYGRISFKKNIKPQLYRLRKLTVYYWMLLNEIPFCKFIVVNPNNRNRSSKFIRNIQANLIQSITNLANHLYHYLGHFYSTVNVMVNIKMRISKKEKFYVKWILAVKYNLNKVNQNHYGLTRKFLLAYYDPREKCTLM